MYDENDGLFDHMPPAVPASAAAGTGQSTVSTAAEFVASSGAASDGSASGDVPIRLGPRVPMFVISPWSKGGKVNSQVFDHTSVIRFLEARFGLQETNITPWRRTVRRPDVGLRFSSADQAVPAIQPPASNMNPNGPAVPIPYPTTTAVPAQATGRSTACRLPYEFFVQGKVNCAGRALALTMTNTGTAGVHLQAWVDGTSTIPRHYTIAAGASQCTTLSDSLALNSGGGYDYRSTARTASCRRSAAASVRPATRDRPPKSACATTWRTATCRSRSTIRRDQRDDVPAHRQRLRMNTRQSYTVAAGATQAVTWYGDGGWYDASIRDANDPNFLRRVAGCVRRRNPARCSRIRRSAIPARSSSRHSRHRPSFVAVARRAPARRTGWASSRIARSRPRAATSRGRTCRRAAARCCSRPRRTVRWRRGSTMRGSCSTTATHRSPRHDQHLTVRPAGVGRPHRADTHSGATYPVAPECSSSHAARARRADPRGTRRTAVRISELVTQADSRDELRVRARVADERPRRADLGLHRHHAAVDRVAARRLLVGRAHAHVRVLRQRIVERGVDLATCRRSGRRASRTYSRDRRSGPA